MEHIVLILGALFFVGGAITIIFKILNQSSIIAFILTGVVAGLLKTKFHLPHDIFEVFAELGIILLLFMAGLEVDFDSFIKRWKIVLKNGLGQILLNTLIGILIGALVLGIKSSAALLYFGLCLTFSSTIVVIGYLKNYKQMESFHGQLILGLMVLQDIVAVTSLAILSSLSGGGAILPSIGMILLKLVLLAAFLYLISKLFLNKLFRYLAESEELLFIGSLGFAMGMAALAEVVHFSPEIAAFMSGAALSFLPYKLEIQDKVEPMKDFGVFLFFVSLGYSLNFSASILEQIGPIVLISIIIVFGTPIIMLLLGYFNKIKSRPSFFMGGIINQISEFSLILATLCVEAGIFGQEIFTIITLSAVLTILLSGIGHTVLENIYKLFKKPLSFIDKHSRIKEAAGLSGFDLNDHIIVIKYNELAEQIIEHFTQLGQEVLLIDLDPEIYDYFKENEPNVTCIYADIFDPDTRELVEMQDAKLIISCLIKGQSAELGILNWLKNKESKAIFIAATDSRQEALELYGHNATFVIQTEDMAAEQLSLILEDSKDDLQKLKDYGDEYIDNLKDKVGHALMKFT